METVTCQIGTLIARYDNDAYLVNFNSKEYRLAGEYLKRPLPPEGT